MMRRNIGVGDCPADMAGRHPKGAGRVPNVVNRACQCDETRMKPRRETPKHRRGVAFGIDGDEYRRDRITQRSQTVQCGSDHLQSCRADVGAGTVAEIDEHVAACEVPVGHAISVLVGQGEGPAHERRTACCLLAERPAGQNRTSGKRGGKHQHQGGEQKSAARRHRLQLLSGCLICAEMSHSASAGNEARKPDGIPEGSLQRPGEEPGVLRLRTLVRLRWLAVAGQAAAVVAVHFIIGFPLPLGLCLAAIALSAWLNVFLTLRWRSSVRLQPARAAMLLGYDVIQLAALLFLTGGLENPFAFLFLVPVTISATSLPLKWTLWLGLLAFACATFLAFSHLPLPWRDGERFELPAVYVGGMWTAIVCGVVFSAIYARRISEEGRQMSAALTATELVLAREQRLSALDGLAAAAAHELGTPLATIALVARELKREIPNDSPYTDDIDLLIEQSGRCREILSRLARRDPSGDDAFARKRATVMLEDLIAPLRGPDVEVTVSAGPSDAPLGGSQEPVFGRNPAIAYGLGNLLENAVDFARRRVEVEARWTQTLVSITVCDDGPGFHQDIFDRLGDPFVTTRPGYDEEPEAGGHQGMGLGFFIAKTLLERSGATVSLANRAQPGRGAVVQVTWPRGVVDAGKPS